MIKLPTKFLSLAVSFLSLANLSNAFETGGANDITAVTGRTSKDYVRIKLADGSFSSEYYAFGKGGPWKGAKADISIDNLSFSDVAHMIALPLADQKYLPSKDPSATKLLIMVYWGTTHAPEHASDSAAYVNLNSAQNAYTAAKMQHVPGVALAEMDDEVTTALSAVTAENVMRESDDMINVKMLGYDSWWESTRGDVRGTPFEMQKQDLFNEIEEDRYFVVLMAYDFQLMWKEKKHKLLWETRFSVRQRHHDFDKDLPTMAQYAAQYFGQDTNGLVHKAVPFGRVEIGEVKSLGEVQQKPSTDAEPSAKSQ